MKIKSFGCSFTYGSDLEDCMPYNKDSCHSMLTWPALLAKKQNLEYECHAWPGIGNLQIMNSVLEQAKLDDPAVFIVNWTWIDRFDYIHPDHQAFLTLRPDGESPTHKLYYKYFFNQYHSMLTNAAYVVSVIKILQTRNIRFFMTAQDKILVEPVDANWHDPRAISMLQKILGPYLHWFDGQTFLEWSRKHGYPESEAWHPLEPAHQAAADYMISVFDKQKIVDPVQQVRV
jgi:hypothetical protein